MVQINRRAALAATAGVGLAVAAKSAALSAPPPPVATPIDLAPRERLRLDFGWRFKLGHAQDAGRDFGYGANQHTYAKAGRGVPPGALDFDDSAWTPVNLPHDWAVDLPFVDSAHFKPTKPGDEDPRASHGYKPLGREFPETSIGWYRKVFTLPAGDPDQRLSIEFDGVFRDCLVVVNGYVLARQDCGQRRLTLHQLLQSGQHVREFVEAVHPLGPSAQLAGGLGAAQQQHTEQRRLGAAEVEGLAQPVLVLGDAAVCRARAARQALVFEAVQGLAHLFLIKVHHRLAVRALVTGVYERVK